MNIKRTSGSGRVAVDVLFWLSGGLDPRVKRVTIRGADTPFTVTLAIMVAVSLMFVQRDFPTHFHTFF